ncbi:MAG TPA: 1,4-dihydroxy-2-naphthoate octaprenyltransferase [Burkholderiales bacterium]|nr:1,4-dihydroxy-2-naphthoate octaprenyltransferase [Burkholderiales bacterium]
MTALAESRAPGRALAWCLALRPWSFTISLAPILAGTSLAVLDGHGAQVGVAVAALAASILIHAGTNLQNDVGDFRRGADGAGRIGPPRATTEGWLPASHVQLAVILCFAFAFLPGAYLVAQGGWPIVAVGIASVAAGAVYTAGPRPVAYSGWGEAFVILFFGLVAVGGMYYLHAGTIGITAVLAGAAIGLLAAAVLVVNNLRDIDSDRRIGKNTLAVRCGVRFTLIEYAFLLLAPFALILALAQHEGRIGLLAPLLLLPWAVRLYLRVRRAPSGAWLNGALASTAKLGLVFAILLSAGTTA